MTKKLRQTEENSCVLVCCAMVMDLPYETVKEYFSRSFCNNCGINDDDLTMMLNEHGFATAWKWRWYSPQKEDRLKWPPKPFAPIHLVKVKVNGTDRLNHIVVMLKDGTIWDPEREEPQKLKVYYSVIGVCGIVPISVTNE